MLPDISNMLSWWQWSLLAVVPAAIVLLYFLKLKRQPIEVPSTYLWRKSVEDLHVNAIWQRLRRNLLLLLQLLIVLLAASALLRPSWQGVKAVDNRLIFLVDNSASMQATDVASSRLQEAKRRVGELIDQMRSGDVAMLISFADTARVEQGFTYDRRQLHRALDGIRATNRGTSLLDALKLAAGLANPGRSAQDISDVQVAEAMPATLYIFSDGRFGPVAGFSLGNLDPKFVCIGSPNARNVAITALNVRRNESRPERLEAFARLENFGREAADVSLELFLDGRMVNADRVELAAEANRGVAFDLGAVESGTLRLKATTGDHFGLDDVAYATVSPARRGRVLLVTPGDEPLRLALQTKGAGEIAEVRVESPAFLKTKTYAEQASAGGWQLAIYDRCRPDRMPACNTFWIGGVPPEGGWSAGKSVGSPQIVDIVGSHPLLQWIDMGDVLVAEGTPLKPPRGGSVLIDSDAGALLAVAPREAFEDAVLGFVILDEAAEGNGPVKRYIGTNWFIRPSFPVFVLNLLEYLGGGREVAEVAGPRPGMPVVLDVASLAGSVSKPSGREAAKGQIADLSYRACTPTGRTVEVAARSGKVAVTETSELGVYEVRSGGKAVRRFAVNLFDAGESAIRPEPTPTIKIGDVKVTGEKGWEVSRREIWKWLVMIGLAVSLLEWYIYIRRVY
ncbi:MAG: BatA and WFA domain-containing protein [Planctomycetaceae bacterium]|nr:BatA and WFA domain-containing protein [Planctomycetaceae bacterium]